MHSKVSILKCNFAIYFSQTLKECSVCNVSNQTAVLTDVCEIRDELAMPLSAQDNVAYSRTNETGEFTTSLANGKVGEWGRWQEIENFATCAVEDRAEKASTQLETKMVNSLKKVTRFSPDCINDNKFIVKQSLDKPDCMKNILRIFMYTYLHKQSPFCDRQHRPKATC